MRCKIGRYVRNERGEMVQAHEVSRHRQYECVHCGKKLDVRTSKCGRVFFVHTEHNKTKQSHDFSHHVCIQRDISRLLATYGIFYKLEHTVIVGLRADIYFLLKNGTKTTHCVLEVQRTPITAVAIKRRIEAYKRKNVKLIWIITKEMSPSVHLKFWEQYIICYAELLLFYDPTKQIYYHLSDYFKCSITRLVIAYQRYDIANIRFLKNTSVRLPFIQNGKISHTRFVQELVSWRMRRLRYKRRNDELTQLLYVMQLQETDVPQEVYTPSVQFLSYNESIFWMQTLIYVLRVKKGWGIQQIIKHCYKQTLIRVNSAKYDVSSYIQYIDNIRLYVK